MRHHHEGSAEVVAQVQDQPVESGRGDRVQPGGGLVEEQQRRVQRHRARDAGPLGHAAGNLRRVQLRRVRQPDQAELHPRHRGAALRRQVGEHLQRQHDVLQQRHRAEQRARLEHHADLPLHRAQRCRAARPGDGLARGCRSARRSASAGRSSCFIRVDLPRARAAEDHEHFARRDAERHVAEDRARAEALRHAARRIAVGVRGSRHKPSR